MSRRTPLSEADVLIFPAETRVQKYRHSEAFLQRQRDLADKIQQGLNNSLTGAEIAVQCGISYATVYTYIKRFGLTRPLPPETPPASAASPTPPPVTKKRRSQALTIEEKRAAALRRYPGIDTNIGKETLETTAKRYDISRERVRQVATLLGLDSNYAKKRVAEIRNSIDPNLTIKENAARLGTTAARIQYHANSIGVSSSCRAAVYKEMRDNAIKRQREKCVAAFGSDTELRYKELARRMEWLAEDGRVKPSFGPALNRLVKFGVLEKGGYGVYRLVMVDEASTATAS